MSLSSLLWAILAPTCGTLILTVLPAGWKLFRDFALLEDKVKSNCESIKSLETNHSLTDARLTRMDQIIEQIRNGLQKQDEQFATITVKLDGLAAVPTKLDSLVDKASAIVPRPEVDVRFRPIEERLLRLEKVLDQRGGQ